MQFIIKKACRGEELVCPFTKEFTRTLVSVLDSEGNSSQWMSEELIREIADSFLGAQDAMSHNRTMAQDCSKRSSLKVSVGSIAGEEQVIASVSDQRGISRKSKEDDEDDAYARILAQKIPAKKKECGEKISRKELVAEFGHIVLSFHNLKKAERIFAKEFGISKEHFEDFLIACRNENERGIYDEF